MPLANYTRAVVGPAFTVKYVPASDPPGTVGDFIDDLVIESIHLDEETAQLDIGIGS